MHVVHRSACRICIEYLLKVDEFVDGDVFKREIFWEDVN
jgi:hypothetical protein